MQPRTLRKGGVVTVRAAVKFDRLEGEDYIHLKIGTSFVMVEWVDLAGFVFARVDEGDKVRWSKGTGEVVAVHGDFVWIKTDNESFETVHASLLSVIPAEPDAPPALPRLSPTTSSSGDAPK